jgi:hypothetical protein
MKIYRGLLKTGLVDVFIACDFRVESSTCDFSFTSFAESLSFLNLMQSLMRKFYTINKILHRKSAKENSTQGSSPAYSIKSTLSNTITKNTKLQKIIKNTPLPKNYYKRKVKKTLQKTKRPQLQVSYTKFIITKRNTNVVQNSN